MMTSWKVTLPCTKAEAEAMQGDILQFAHMDMPPVLMTSEPDPARPDDWQLDAYFDAEPDAAIIAQLRLLVPSADGVECAIEEIEDQDWVTLSQQGIEPVRAGRFFVHTPAFRHAIPANAIALEIDAGRAFGTGQHETTTGCMIALDTLKNNCGSFNAILDLGTGTGLLAFAALKLWPAASITASDIDPVSIEVTRENAAINFIPLGQEPGQVEPAIAAGMDHPSLQARAPYGLIIANILAGPLIELAPSVASALAPGGRLILAGLLDSQADKVAEAYQNLGLKTDFSIVRGEWPTLVLHKPSTPGAG